MISLQHASGFSKKRKILKLFPKNRGCSKQQNLREYMININPALGQADAHASSSSPNFRVHQIQYRHTKSSSPEWKTISNSSDVLVITRSQEHAFKFHVNQWAQWKKHCSSIDIGNLEFQVIIEVCFPTTPHEGSTMDSHSLSSNASITDLSYTNLVPPVTSFAPLSPAAPKRLLHVPRLIPATRNALPSTNQLLISTDSMAPNSAVSAPSIASPGADSVPAVRQSSPKIPKLNNFQSIFNEISQNSSPVPNHSILAPAYQQNSTIYSNDMNTLYDENSVTQPNSAAQYVPTGDSSSAGTVHLLHIPFFLDIGSSSQKELLKQFTKCRTINFEASLDTMDPTGATHWYPIFQVSDDKTHLSKKTRSTSTHKPSASQRAMTKRINKSQLTPLTPRPYRFKSSSVKINPLIHDQLGSPSSEDSNRSYDADWVPQENHSAKRQRDDDLLLPAKIMLKKRKTS